MSVLKQKIRKVLDNRIRGRHSGQEGAIPAYDLKYLTEDLHALFVKQQEQALIMKEHYAQHNID